MLRAHDLGGRLYRGATRARATTRKLLPAHDLRSPAAVITELSRSIRYRPVGVGFVQATISEQNGELTADVAWAVAVSQQHSGYAREAAQLMADWLRQRHIQLVVAHVHHQHHASNAVARSIGLAPTDMQLDGKVRWQG